MTLTRRELLIATAAAALPVTIEGTRTPAMQERYGAAFAAIDAFVERYLREMNAPGLALAIADRNEVIAVNTYGRGDLARNEPVRPEQLFHIGSISKSFTALVLMQLAEEGKLDVQAPVTKYLPWLKIDPRDITTHHLLTHSSGLPSWAPVFPSDPNAKHTAGFTPGAHFHYCNLGYEILGHLIEALDGKPYAASVRARILAPLKMHASEAAIAPAQRARTVDSYIAFRDDVPLPRHGRLADAPQIMFLNAAGSVASTSGDMALYLRMLANRGKGLVSEKSFAAMTKRHVTTEPPNENAYGYGLFVETLDDHEIVRHTGGMVSFMSAMHVDPGVESESGIGVFASINAQQGYRPNPISIFALRAIRAAKAQKPMPELPAASSPAKIGDARELAGVFTSPSGEKIEFIADGDALFLVHGGKRLPVEIASGAPYVQHPDFELFQFHFERERPDGTGPAISVGHGEKWWASERYGRPRTFVHPEVWRAYTGHYRSEDPWVGSLRIVARQGRLWANGMTPLREVSPTSFRFTERVYSPEWIEFLSVVNGAARQIKLSGFDLWRVAIR